MRVRRREIINLRRPVTELQARADAAGIARPQRGALRDQDIETVLAKGDRELTTVAIELALRSRWSR
jgi:hypothetical protein